MISALVHLVTLCAVILMVCIFRKVDTKPGGPPVESIHEHSSSPARTYAPLIADSPERRQVSP